MIEWEDNYPTCNLPDDKSGTTLAADWDMFTEHERNLIWTAMEWESRGSVNIALVPFMDRGLIRKTVGRYLETFISEEPELMLKLEESIDIEPS